MLELQVSFKDVDGRIIFLGGNVQGNNTSVDRASIRIRLVSFLFGNASENRVGYQGWICILGT